MYWYVYNYNKNFFFDLLKKQPYKYQYEHRELMFLFHTKKEHLIKTSSVWIKNPTIPTGTTSTNLYQPTRSMMTIDGHVEAAHTKKIVEGIKVSTKFKANPLGLVAKYGSLACLMCCAGVTLEHIDCFGTNKPVKNAHDK